MEVLSVAYAQMYSQSYRDRYEESLRMDYPRVFATRSEGLRTELGRLGAELISLHLLESAKLNHPMTTFEGPSSAKLGRVGWSDNTVWLDAAATRKGQAASRGTMGFKGVPEGVWNFHIGGYQVCEKWLKDRKGRTLSEDDINHYQRIVVALSETIRVMGENRRGHRGARWLARRIRKLTTSPATSPLFTPTQCLLAAPELHCYIYLTR